MRDLGELARLAVERLTRPPELGRTAEDEELRSLVGDLIGEDGIGATEAIRIWREVLAPACIAVDHPRYLAFIPGAPTKLAAAFDMVVGASSIYGGSWLEAAGATFAENQALRWIADLVGMPAEAGGTFVQGGTVGNLSALVTARDVARSERPEGAGRWAACVTAETHSSIVYALRTVMDAEVFLIPGDPRGRMTGAALGEFVADLSEQDRRRIFAVVASAGTTNTGVVDDISGVAEVAHRHGWWLHVDGAYGGAGLVAPTIRDLYAGIERADSFIVDPHKWLFGPFDCCALLYRDPAHARAAHTQHADYLEAVHADDREWNSADYALHLTRRARGLPLWFSLVANGVGAYRDAVERTLATTRAGAEMIRRSPDLELLVDPDLTVLTFVRRGWEAADYARWSEALLESGDAFVAATTYQGEPCARLAIVNPATSVDDLRFVLDRIG